jgi:HSP20 family protein
MQLQRAFSSPLRIFGQDFDQVFRDLVNQSTSGTDAACGAQGFAPALDVSESDGRVSLQAELPGVDPKEIHVSVHGNVVEISGSKTRTEEHKDERFHRRERSSGSFCRRVRLPAKVDADSAKAEYHAGVLTVEWQKDVSTTPRKVEVTVR